MNHYKVIKEKVEGSKPGRTLTLYHIKIGDKEVCSYYDIQKAYSVAGKLNRGEPVTDEAGFRWSHMQEKWVMSE